MFKLPHNCTHLHASKVMLKIVQARLQQYVYCELPDAQAGFRKGRGTRDQIANIRWIIKKGRERQKKSTSALLTMSKLLSGGSQYTVENSSRDGNTRPLTCLLQKSVCRSRTTFRTRHATTDWFQTQKGVHQGCILSPCLFNLYAESS